MKSANLIEIFQSLQGEGPYVGEPMVFVRFQDCALSCAYCDTPASFEKHTEFRLERAPQTGEFLNYSNPIASDSLTELVEGFESRTLSLTGGEPLQHGEFLQDWLPRLQGRFRVLLETNGLLVQELEKILPWIDIISMDFKLPSSTHLKAYWEEHEAFLALAQQKEIYIKLVVARRTPISEIEQAIALVQKFSLNIPFILQPVTPFGRVREGVELEQLKEFYEFSKRHLSDVRVIPQLHAALGIL